MVMSETMERTRTMRAWAIDAYGGPERLRLREVPVPEPKSREVLVRMQRAEMATGTFWFVRAAGP